MKLTLIALSLILAAALLWAVRLPRTRAAEATRELAAPVERVFAVVTDIEDASWRSDLKDVRVLDRTPGREVWEEIPHRGPPIRFRTRARVSPERFEIEIVDGNGFGGHWVGEFHVVAPDRTRLRFVETAFTEGLVPTVMSHLFFDPERAVRTYLDDLARKLGG